MKRLALVIAMLAWAGGQAAFTQTAAAGGPQPYVEFRMLRSGQTTPGATVGDDIKPGAPVAAQFTARDSLCQSTFGAASIPHDEARTIVKLTADLLDQKDGAYSFRLESRHLKAEGRATSQAFTQVVSMRDGDRVTLDMLRDPSPAAGCTTSTVTLEAKLLLKPDPALARALYVADLWFVHRDETGHEWTRHATTNVNASVDAPLLFNDITFPLPKLDPGQDVFTAFVRLSGTLRARPRADGLVVLEVSTQRGVGILLPSNQPGTYGASRRMTLTVKPDETAAIEIPQPASGFVMTALRIGEKMPFSGRFGAGPADGTPDPMASQPAVFINKGAYVLNTGVYFKNHVTRLLIRVRRAQDAAPDGQ
jgi:hypothetical protein